MIKSIILFATSLLLIACTNNKPSQVEILSHESGYKLLVNGEHFPVRGVAIDSNYGSTNLKLLKDIGGNSFRTYHYGKIDEELALAKKYGLMVMIGLQMGRDLEGFNYNDQQAVEKQYQRITSIVDKYKHHPNLLAWIIGNEVDLHFDSDNKRIDVNPKIYSELARIIDYIHQHDPNHPTTFSFAGAGKEYLDTALSLAPNVDFISIQLYEGLGDIPNIVDKANLTKPFMITETGPLGHWESPYTSWGREIEQPSGKMAEGIANRVQTGLIDAPPGNLIGTYFFVWGHKQERTPTWYGMLNKTGEATSRVDELIRYWRGEYPANRAPHPTKITLNGMTAEDSVRLKPDQKASLNVSVFDPDNDSLTVKWQLLGEVDTRSQGGLHENAAQTMELNIIAQEHSDSHYSLQFKTPSSPGEYRIFGYFYDGKNKVGNANFPFLVED